MSRSFSEYTILRLFLLLIALHSLITGVMLITLPPSWMTPFGFNAITEPFFKAQGGVFHLVMVAAYLPAARNPNANQVLIRFSIIAKLMAVLFLIPYFIFVSSNLVVLLSGLGDLLMGAILFYLWKAVQTKQSIS